MNRLRRSMGRFVKLIVFVMLAAPAAAWADEVVLKNGDRLSGDILGMEKGMLKMKTAQVGTVAIEWSEIRSLTSDKPFSIETTDENTLMGALYTPAAGQLTG